MRSRWLDVARQRLGTGAAAVVCLGAVVAMGMAMRGDERSAMDADVNEQIWIDSDGNAFPHRLTVGEIDVMGPNGKPAFRAELCYWTADGKVKTEPTAVLLNGHVGRPGPTFCPDCHRLVTSLNRVPQPGAADAHLRPPPTESEHRARDAARTQGND